MIATWFKKIKTNLVNKNKTATTVLTHLLNQIETLIASVFKQNQVTYIERGKIDQLIDETEKPLKNFSEKLFARKTLIAVFKKLKKEFGIKTASIPSLLLIKRDKSRMSLKTGYDRLCYENVKYLFKEALLKVLETDSKSLSKTALALHEKQRAALFFLVLMMENSVLEKPLLEEIVKLGFKHVRLIKNGPLYISADANAQKAAPGMQKNQYFQDMTLFVYLNNRRFFKRQKKLKSLNHTFGYPFNSLNDVFETIQQLLSSVQTENIRPPKTLNDLLNAVTAKRNFQLPAFQLDYLSGKNPAFSISSDNAQNGLSFEDDEEDQILLKITERYSGKPLSDDEKFLIKFYHAMEHNTPSACLNMLNRQQKSLTSNTIVIAQWLLDQRKRQHSQGAVRISLPVQIDFCDKTLRFIKKATFTLKDPNCLEKQTDFYETLLANCPTKKQSNQFSVLIQRLHRFLEKNYSVDKIVDFDDIDGFAIPGQRVNANYLTPTKAKQVKEALRPGQFIQQRMATITYLIFVLAFRLGLRRGEIRRLRIGDIKALKRHALCEIRNTDLGTTKTDAGWRDLPLYEMLTESEIEELLEWHQQRKTETTDDSELLFSAFTTGKITISAQNTFDHIVSVMRSVKMDPTLRFHSLRHAFVSWSVYRFSQVQFERCYRLPFRPLVDLGEPLATPHPGAYKLVSAEEKTKKLLYDLAVRTGHTTPYISILHYTHTLDWVTYNFLRPHQMKVDKRLLGALLGVKPSQLYSKLKTCGLDTQSQEYSLENCIEKGMVKIDAN